MERSYWCPDEDIWVWDPVAGISSKDDLEESVDVIEIGSAAHGEVGIWNPWSHEDEWNSPNVESEWHEGWATSDKNVVGAVKASTEAVEKVVVTVLVENIDSESGLLTAETVVVSEMDGW